MYPYLLTSEKQRAGKRQMPGRNGILSCKRRREVAAERMLILKVGDCRLDYLFFDVMNDESNIYRSPIIAIHSIERIDDFFKKIHIRARIAPC